MHCEVVIPGLLSLAAPVRAPALELLLARGRASRGESASMEAWLREAFGLPSLAAGALTVMGEGAETGAATWARADPVHLRLLRDRMVVLPGEALHITKDEADALCAALNAHFAGRLVLRVADPVRWSARLSAPLAVGNDSALAVAGATAAPGGAADALLTEIQMALHTHPVNEARETRGEPPVNSVWLWGAGSAPRGVTAPWQSVTAADPVARGLARAAGARGRAASPGSTWLERSAEEGRHLVVLDSLRPFAALADTAGFAGALQALEQEWFAPLLRALRDGRIGMLTVHVPDAREALSVETVRGDLRRIWRRPRSLGAWIG
jgi:hypothetical protein